MSVATSPTLTVRLREVYGRTLAYPACAASQGIAAIAGTRTLTPHALRAAAAMGYAIKDMHGAAVNLDSLSH